MPGGPPPPRRARPARGPLPLLLPPSGRPRLPRPPPTRRAAGRQAGSPGPPGGARGAGGGGGWGGGVAPGGCGGRGAEWGAGRGRCQLARHLTPRGTDGPDSIRNSDFRPFPGRVPLSIDGYRWVIDHCLPGISPGREPMLPNRPMEATGLDPRVLRATVCCVVQGARV